MADAFRDKMKNVCGQMLEEELKACSLERMASCKEATEDKRDLQDEKFTTQLAERIAALPVEDQSLLYLHYCFNIGDRGIDDVLGMDHSFEKRSYIEKVLSVFAGKDLKQISYKNLKEASEKALEAYISSDVTIPVPMPVYSLKFRKKLKKIHAAQKIVPQYLRIARQAAIILLALGLTFSTAMVVNADFREWILEWVVETFPEFTRFHLYEEKIDGMQFVELSSYDIGYIPEGFYLLEKSERSSMIVYRYVKGENEKITISIKKLAVGSSFNTEEANLETISFGDSTAFCWNKGGKEYMVWKDGGAYFSIVSTSERREVIKIAKKIKK